MVAPPATIAGALFTVAVVTIWLAATRPPARVIRLILALGLLLFGPYFLLLALWPPAPGAATGNWRAALLIPWSVLLRGLSGMLVSVATVTTLSMSDLFEALACLPLPNMVSALVLAIVQQSATLVHETQRVAAAMAVRGASGGGVAVWRVLQALPQVWLPRVIARAERAGAAMELRGYGADAPRPFRSPATGIADGVALSLCAAALVLAIVLRVWAAA